MATYGDMTTRTTDCCEYHRVGGNLDFKCRPAKRFTVQTDNIPHCLQVLGFVAWVRDANHPDDPGVALSCSWHQSRLDAERVCAALNNQPPRQPTEAMIDAGYDHVADPCWRENLADAWRAMFDAGLGV